MRKIDIKECHKLLLGIAKEFDAICTKHNIPYYMLGGTMLGAIRHKGLIPWDDDMDFGVPYEHYNQLIDILEKELPERYKCFTHNNCESVKSPFAKISDTQTRINDPRIKLPIEKQIGVNIDIFPLYSCEPEDAKIKDIHKVGKVAQVLFVEPPTKNRLKSLIKQILRILCPISNSFLINKRLSIAAGLKKGNYLANIFGRWKEKEIIPVEWYGENVRFQFEDTTLCGIKEYDKYLTSLYNHYMELPPVGSRFCHTQEIFLYTKDL